jgi:hypothetical protein
MKLGTETGSVMNHLYSRGTIGQPEPAVGMGVTLLHWTDRSPGTIFRVLPGKQVVIEVRRDNYRMVSGSAMSESQGYEFTTSPSGSRSFFRREDDGRWQEVRVSEKTGRFVKGGSTGLRIGERGAYRDPSF